MGSRGGELGGEQIDILTSNEAICIYIRDNWKYHTHWADKAKDFCIDDQGDKLQVKDVLNTIETAILGSGAKTKLNDAVRKSQLKKDEFVSIVARAVYESANPCLVSMAEILKRCKEK